MLSQADNELLTRTGPGTPMGNLMRRYWIPVTFTHQIAEPDCPPIRVKIMGENLVAFRDTDGRPGLLDEKCPHRTASLFFGRNEECGLRCVYHGWKFDIEGKCVDLPSEPPGSNFQDKITTKAYPCHEQGGVVWAYMGPPELKPDFPALEWTLLPDDQKFLTRHVQECNWLQGVEGGFDNSHLAFLHRGSGAINQNAIPLQYEAIETDFGLIAGTGRDAGNGNIRWASDLMIMPFHKLFATRPHGAHMWVPIDDDTTMLYSVDYYPDRPLDDEVLERSKDGRHIHTENIPGTDHTVRNMENFYLIDREEQASGASFTGIKGVGTQDCAIQESMGPIADRTKEHLGVSDIAIIQIRKKLLETVQAHERGETPPGLNPGDYRARSTRFELPPGEDYVAAAETHLAEQLG
ncbi:MAG: phthalate 4,5-dioxygenase oxygenase subunit [Alphaproteobacteria bacterium]|jgi:phthalate 4,5-dioxygenase oxygenase subunit